MCRRVMVMMRVMVAEATVRRRMDMTAVYTEMIRGMETCCTTSSSSPPSTAPYLQQTYKG